MVNVCIAMARATIRLQRIQLPVSSETFYGTLQSYYCELWLFSIRFFGPSTKVVDLRMIKSRHVQAKRKSNNNYYEVAKLSLSNSSSH